MTKEEKLKEKIRNGQNVSFDEADSLLKKMGYSVRSKGSHFSYKKTGCATITLKRRNELLEYQLRLLEDAIK